MKGDFTRNTFDPQNHFSRVLMQQGRVTLDADHNEQTDILLHYLRTLARDLIGPYAAPAGEEGGFVLSVSNNELMISRGRYYVDGILIENEADCPYSKQPNYDPLPEDDALSGDLRDPTGGQIVIYLDVWERHVTWLEQNSIREKALGGPDTCTRTQVVWQVKSIAGPSGGSTSGRRADLIKQLEKLQQELKAAIKAREGSSGAERARLDKVIARLEKQIAKIEAQIRVLPEGEPTALTCKDAGPLLPKASDAMLSARVDPGQKVQDPCITPPDNLYRGAENQLYRIEIHQGGTADEATFKWSRDNGSLVTSWLNTVGNDLHVGSTRGFAAGNWVELSDDIQELHGQPGVLVKLAKVDSGGLSVDPASIPTTGIAWASTLVNPKVRRWDQTETEDIELVNGAIPITESQWIDLEDGVQVQFSPLDNGKREYHSEDYWLVAARSATGEVEWPPKLDADGQPDTDTDGNVVPDSRPPLGVTHYYAPLGIVQIGQGGDILINDAQLCRCTFDPIWKCPAQS
jgi:hypothetical protein